MSLEQYVHVLSLQIKEISLEINDGKYDVDSNSCVVMLKVI